MTRDDREEPIAEDRRREKGRLGAPVASVVTDKSKAEEFAKTQGMQGYELGTMELAEFGD